MSDSMREPEYVPTSKFYMFRCLIAMAHSDGVFCEQERAYMYAFMNHQGVPLTKEQYSTLEEDMEAPKDFSELITHINDPKYRSQLPYFARIMAHKDGVLHPNEEQLLEAMRLKVTDGLDMDGIRKEVQDAVAYDMAAHDIEIDKLRPKSGLFGVFDRIMMSIGIDLMREDFTPR